MERTDTLPSGVCSSCAKNAQLAANFIDFCQRSNEQWYKLTEYLYNLKPIVDKKGYYILIDGISEPTLVTDQIYGGDDVGEKYKRIKKRLTQRACSIRKHKKSKILNMQKYVNSKKINCPDCMTNFTDSQALDRHLRCNSIKSCYYCQALIPFSEMREHCMGHEVKIYSCKICFEPFHLKSKLEIHSKLHAVNNFECQLCKYILPSSIALKYHATLHINKTCSKCFKYFTNKVCFSKHVSKCWKQSTMNKQKIHQCSVCKTGFDSLCELNEHLLYDSVQVCRNCNNVVAITELHRHMKDHNAATVLCTKCLKPFDCVDALEVHNKSHRTDDQKCNFCHTPFETAFELLAHMKKNHRKYCPNCNKTFINLICFDKHAESCTSKVSYTCSDCDAKFTTFRNLYEHLKESRKRACWVCGELCPIDRFREHLKRHDMPTFCCDVCPDTFYNISRLRLHKRIHKPNPYVCGECRHTFRNNSGLYGHSAVHHVKTCACLKRFNNRACYAHHKKICDKHGENNKFICDYCKVEYNYKTALRSHISLKHMYGCRHQCDVCGKRFASSQHLKEHENTHNRVNKYTCPICGKLMSTRRGYEKHALLHTGAKPHHCPYCVAKFAQGWQKTSHIMSKHSDNIEVYQCEHCPTGKKYSQPQNLQKHLEEKHGLVVDIEQISNKRKQDAVDHAPQVDHGFKKIKLISQIKQ